MSWPVAPATRDRPVAPLILGHRAGRAWLLAGLVLGLVLAQWLRRRRWERLGEPSHDRTLRHPSRPERDRVAERDGHGADPTDSDQHRDANVNSNPDVGRRGRQP